MPADSTAAVVYHPAWNSLPTLIWATLLLLALLAFRRHVVAILQLLLSRIHRGVGFRLGSFEIQSQYVTPAGDISNGDPGTARHDQGGKRHEQREAYYVPNRLVMLVHRLAPSVKPGQLYDILIYCVPHPRTKATLSGVKQVEYYFGRSWGERIFTSIDRARGFAVSTSAFGPFMCTAEIHFSDGQKAMVSRYVDFEMGAVGPAPLVDDKKTDSRPSVSPTD